MTRDAPFDRRVVIAFVVAGVLAFAAFLWLSAYAPAMRRFDTSDFAPMSKNAVGFAGTYKLIEDVTGEHVGVLEDDESLNEPGLVIMPLATDSDPASLRSFAEARARNVTGGATLFVLPKWRTMPVAAWGSDWVQKVGLVNSFTLDPLVGAIAHTKVDVSKTASRGFTGIVTADRPVPDQPVTLVAGASITPLLALDDGRAVLARVDDVSGGTVYLLSDPDLLSNHALKTEAGARAALAIVQAVRPSDQSQITTDPVPARGEAPKAERNLLQLMFEPPFLAVTLAILAAALLAALHAFGRFGRALPEERAIPFGKRALADNAAVLFARAGAVGRLGDRYVAMTRDAAAQALGATHLSPPALEAWLARLPRARGPSFAVLAADLRGAGDAQGVRAGAAAMHDWKDEVMRDR